MGTKTWEEVYIKESCKLADAKDNDRLGLVFNYLSRFNTYLDFFLAFDRLSAKKDFRDLVLAYADIKFPKYWLEWNNINIKVPYDQQNVVYYFDVFNHSYKGQYEKCSEPEYGTHTFFSKYGFLTDDVTYWIGR